jgi:hypothetical protein
MKSFSKYLICFVVVALALSVGVPQAKADSLLFPFFASGGGAFTFFSVQTWSANNGVLGGVPIPVNAHAVYNYVNLTYPTAGTYTIDGSACNHRDVPADTTPQDLMQWEATKLVDSSLPPLSQTHSHPPYLTGTVSPGAGVVGFMIYDDEQGNVPNNSIEATLPGDAAIIDLNTGLVAGYKALNNFLPTAASAAAGPGVPGVPACAAAPSTNPGNWSFCTSSLATSLHPTAKLTWMMSNYEKTDVDTEWFIVVTGPHMGNPWRGQLRLQNGFAAFGFPQNLWNQNEQWTSDNKPMPVTCFRSFTRADIMTNTAWTDNGGMWWEVAGVPCYTDGTNGAGALGPIGPIGLVPANCGVAAPGFGANPGRGAVMLKLQSTKVLGTGLAGKNVWTLTHENAWPNLPY